MSATPTHAATPLRHTRAPWLLPTTLTLGILAARIAAVPALSDPVNGTVPTGVHLSAPWLYLVLGPLFTTWDGISMLGMTRLKGFLIGCAILYILWRVVRARYHRLSWRRELITLVIALPLFLAFIAAGALWHRPMLALAGTNLDDVVVDYHSHTNASRDVRKTAMRDFDVEASRQWHARAGFDVFLVTDHNMIHEPADQTTLKPQTCPGTEISGWGAHTVLLGPTPKIRTSDYGTEHGGLLTLISTTDSAYGALSIASLPEYERAHWDGLNRLVDAGLDGFEVVNASPKANEMSLARRDTVIDLARRTGRLVVGVSDSHGWGATSMVWNLVSVPGWRDRPASVCGELLAQLRRGFPANRIIERHRLRTDAWWPTWLTPVGMLWETWRSLGWTLTGSWLIWIWLGYLWSALHPWNRHASLPFSRYRFRRS